MSDHPKPAGAPPVKDAHSRLHRCFELALTCAQEDPSWTLIHGVIHARIAHAWVRKGDWLYDPVKDISMSVVEYERICQAKEERAYTAKDASAMAWRTGHWGPWHAESVSLQLSEILRELAESARVAGA